MTNKVKTIGMGLITSFALFSNTLHAKPVDEVFAEIEKSEQEYSLAVEEMDERDAGEMQKDETINTKVIKHTGLYDHHIQESKEAKLQMIIWTAPSLYEEVKKEGEIARKKINYVLDVINRVESDDTVYKSCRILLHTFDKLKEDKQKLENLYDKALINKNQYQKTSKHIAQKSQDKTLQAKIKTCKKQYGDAL